MDLSQPDWKEKLSKTKNAIILDVRTDEEFNEKHIPNAINLDIRLSHEFVEEIQKLDSSKSYFIYCRSGNRSGQAVLIMNQFGFDNTFSLTGGILEWTGDTVVE